MRDERWEAGHSRVDELADDILAAPDELAAALDQHQAAIAALPEELLDRPRWRLIGMGSSRFAALDAAAAMRAAGRDAAAEVASASGGSPPGADTLAIVISNSGRTAESVAAAARHRHRSAVLAVTANPESPLAREADAVLPLVAGRAETSGIATLSYRSTVAALELLGAVGGPALAGMGIAAAVPALETLLERRAAWLSAAADALDTGRSIHVLGDGTRIGGLEQAALMFREAPRIEAAAWDTGDWLHVGLYTRYPGDAVLLFTGSPADGEAIAVVHARGGRVVAVGERHPDADVHVPLPDPVDEEPAVRALVEPAVADLVAAELWRRADAQIIREAPGGE
jgi:glucosamine--fructose-6-phosphate aminotransferase (isomerizing)